MIGKYILLWAGVFFATGIFAADFFVVNLWSTGAALCVLSAVLFLCYKSGKTSIVLIGSAFFICLAGLVRMEIADQIWQNRSQHLVGSQGTFYGVVAGEASGSGEEKKYIRYPVELDRIVYPEGTEKRVSGSAYVYDRRSDKKYRIGDEICVRGKLQPLHIYKNPGKIILDGRYRSQGILGRIYGKQAGDISFVKHGNSYFFLQKSVFIRDKIRQIFASYVAEERLPVLMSLLFGGHYGEIPKTVTESFSVTGIIHILSVSGSHIALLFGFLYLIGKYLGLPQRFTAVISILLILVYGGIAGFVPPVIRSSVMGILAVLGVCLEEKGTSLNFLGAAVLGMLLWDPHYLYDVSFELSAGASAGILLFYRPIINALNFSFLPDWIKEGIALSCSAQIPVFPLILYYFHSFPLYFIPANLLVTPLLEWVIIAGLLSILIFFVIKPLAVGILYAADYLLCGSLVINQWISMLPKASLPLGGMSPLSIIFYYAGIMGIYFRNKLGKIPYMACTGGVLLVFAALIYFFNQRETTVFVPELGMDRGVLLVSKNTKIVYYRYSDYFSERNRDEFLSFLSYQGVFDTDLLILNGENLKQKREITPVIPAGEIWVTGNKLQIKKDISGKIRYINTGKWQMKNEIRLQTNGSAWTISGEDWSLFLAGNQNKNLGEGMKHTLWIGGADPFRSAVESILIKKINPELAVYTGAGKMSGTDTETFVFYDCPVYQTALEGMISAGWTGSRWDADLGVNKKWQ